MGLSSVKKIGGVLFRISSFRDCCIFHPHGKYRPKRRQPSAAGGNVQKSPSSKAANCLSRPAGCNRCLTRGAYMKYVSTAKWRPACAKPLRRRQGTPLAAFFNIPIWKKLLPPFHHAYIAQNKGRMVHSEHSLSDYHQ